MSGSNRPTQPGDLLRPKEATEILGISLASVYNLMARGELRWVAVLRHGRRIRRSDLEEYLEAQTKGGWANSPGKRR